MEPRDYPPMSWTASPESGTIPVLGELVDSDAERLEDQADHEEVHERRILLPAFLFLATCVSTFFAGAQMSRGGGGLGALGTTWWQDGLIYMFAVMGILLAHEMGHFLQAVRYRVPASLPFFIPMPISPMGTMGAVIALPGAQSHRKELFDIGLTGPLAGLAVAIPVTWIGIKLGTPFVPVPGSVYKSFNDPLIVQWMVAYMRPEIASGTLFLNPLLLAGWVGMLITGLNMMPVSQLDGGHVLYALFGKRSYWLARGFVFAAMLYMVLSNHFAWMPMLMLVMLIGVDHPPTADDSQSLGWGRRLLGLFSLVIPILCFSPVPWSLVPA